MRLVIAILRDVDDEPVSKALTSAGFRMTMIASTGGLLRRGRSTFLIGLEDNQVDTALEVIRRSCAPAAEPGQQRAVIFVVPVLNYTHF
jgi:uncharacterized protein YaaQ